MDNFSDNQAINNCLQKLGHRERLVLHFLHHTCGAEVMLKAYPYTNEIQYRLEIKRPDGVTSLFGEIYAQLSAEWLLKEALKGGVQLWVAPFIEGLWMVRVKNSDGEVTELIGENMIDPVLKASLVAVLGSFNLDEADYKFISG